MTSGQRATVRALLREHRRRSFTAEGIAAGHVPQLESMLDGSLNVIDMTSRRAGKSNNNCGVMGLDTQEEARAGTQIYFGATKPAVRLSIWSKIWIPFCSRWRLRVNHNETTMVSRFPTGDVVAFTGTDDIRHVETYLGNKLKRAVVDEAQGQPPSVLDPLIYRILPPALSDEGGQLRLSGTIPEVPAGTFYEIWLKAQKADSGWSPHNWSRFQNPHMGSPEKQQRDLDHYLRTSGYGLDHPLVRRDWFGEFVFDPSATAYAYDRTRNGYAPELLRMDMVLPSGRAMAARPFPGVDTFSCAIDPGSGDRFSVEVNGWGASFKGVQHVFDWASDRNARLTWGQVAPILAFVQATYGPVHWRYDAGSSKNELDLFTLDYGVPAIKAAEKADLPGQVRRVNDLLLKGLYRVMIGSTLEEDYQKARWDRDARARQQWKWAAQWHPDPSESSRYSLADFFDQYVERAEVTTEAAMFEAHLAKMKVAQRDRDAQAMGLDEPMFDDSY